MLNINSSINEFLLTQPNAILCTIKHSDGSPQVSPVWYVFQDSSFIVGTSKKTAKWHNISKNPAVAMCIDNPETHQMVSIYGLAYLVEIDVWELTRRIVQKYEKTDEAVQKRLLRLFSESPRGVILIKPNRIVSRKLY